MCVAASVDLRFSNCNCKTVPCRTFELRKVCEVSKVQYIGVAKVQRVVWLFASDSGGARHAPWVHIHVSTPCGSESPLCNFNQDSVTEKNLKRNAIGSYFKHADLCSFELAERNAIWSRPKIVDLL